MDLISIVKSQLIKVSWFGVVGILSAVLYAVTMAVTIDWLSWRPLPASTAGYLAAMCGSYFGHKILTFKSKAPHLRAAPRFLVQAALGYAIAQGVTYCVNRLGMHYAIGIAVVVVALPILNFLLLQFWVFTARHHGGAADQRR